MNENSDFSSKQVSTDISQQWKALSEQEKEVSHYYPKNANFFLALSKKSHSGLQSLDVRKKVWYSSG